MQPLLLLHGALGSKKQLEPLAELLQNDFIIYTLNYSGHGGEPFSSKGFSIDVFAAEVNGFLQQHKLSNIPVFGYSMGGYVGMYLHRHYPGTVSKLITLATKFNWTTEIAAKQQKMFNAEVIKEKVPDFAALLEKLHGPGNWEQLAARTAAMLTEMGNRNPLSAEDYALIDIPVLLMQGDQDRMVPIEETLSVFRQLPAAQLGILPGTPHPLEQTNTEMLAYHIKRFLL